VRQRRRARSTATALAERVYHRKTGQWAAKNVQRRCRSGGRRPTSKLPGSNCLTIQRHSGNVSGPFRQGRDPRRLPTCTHLGPAWQTIEPRSRSVSLGPAAHDPVYLTGSWSERGGGHAGANGRRAETAATGSFQLGQRQGTRGKNGLIHLENPRHLGGFVIPARQDAFDDPPAANGSRRQSSSSPTFTLGRPGAGA